MSADPVRGKIRLPSRPNYLEQPRDDPKLAMERARRQVRDDRERRARRLIARGYTARS